MSPDESTLRRCSLLNRVCGDTFLPMEELSMEVLHEVCPGWTRALRRSG